MIVLGADAVEAASRGANGSGGTLQVGPRDILTPLAAERARDLGIEVVRAPRAPAPPSSGAGGASRTDQPVRPALSARPAQPARPAPATPGFRPTSPGSGAGATPRVRFDTPPPVPLSPALYRRGAPIALAGRPQQTGQRTRTRRVVVVGAGHVGAHTATRIAESDLVDEVVLVDVVDGLAAGVALDITHAAGLLGFTTRVRDRKSVV